jgi:hypothetical protein
MKVQLVRSAVAAAAVAALVGTLAAGCGSHRSTSVFNDQGDEGLAANSPTVVAIAAGDLALQACLALMDPANHDVITPRPNVSVSGNTVTLDFGSSSSTGNEVAEVDLRDDVQATFVRSGNTGTVNVTFPSLVASTDHLGTVDVIGSIVYTCNFSGATCTGTMTIDVTTDGFDVSQVSGVLDYTITNGVIRHSSNGAVDTDTALRGDWTSSLSNIELDLTNPAARSIESGSVALTRTTGSALGVSLLFTSPDAGTLTITPGSTTRSFRL